MALFLVAVHAMYRRFDNITVCVAVFVVVLTAIAAGWPLQWQHVVFSVWFVLLSSCCH